MTGILYLGVVTERLRNLDVMLDHALGEMAGWDRIKTRIADILKRDEDGEVRLDIARKQRLRENFEKASVQICRWEKTADDIKVMHEVWLQKKNTMAEKVVSNAVEDGYVINAPCDPPSASCFHVVENSILDLKHTIDTHWHWEDQPKRDAHTRHVVYDLMNNQVVMESVYVRDDEWDGKPKEHWDAKLKKEEARMKHLEKLREMSGGVVIGQD